PLGGPEQSPKAQTAPRFVTAEADHSQEGFPVASALTGGNGKGWAIDGPGRLGAAHTATFTLDRPVKFTGRSDWQLRLVQSFGTHHTLGRFRISIGTPEQTDAGPLETRRQAAIQRRFAEWLREHEARAVRWRAARPEKVSSNLPLLTVEQDDAIFV